MDSNSWEIVDVVPSPRKEINSNKEESEETIDNKIHRYGQNVKNYETEWRDLCLLAAESGLTKLKNLAIAGELKVSKFRSVCWNVLLEVLLGPSETWIAQRNEQRKVYQEIKQTYSLNPHTLPDAAEEDNPLSQSKDSLWNQHFRDQELCSLIKQDVVRTNPNVDFYRKENIQEIMINILFCYAREYPAICYRQGMHEILAPLIFVLHCDHQNLGHIQEETTISLDPILVKVLDPNYLEEDSYHLFCRMMHSLELFYRINDMTITESGQLTNIPDDSPESPYRSSIKKSSEIEVVHQLNIIRDKILAKQDLHLHNHLLKLDIPLALFGIRWLRLLFGREFTLLDLLVLWDAIIGVGDNLKFTYYIVVAMLIRIRDKLLSSDYTSCLTLLMRYPPNVDVSLIIRHALYMQSPDKYQCPPNAFVYVISSMKQFHRMQSSPTRKYPLENSKDLRPQASTMNRKSSEEMRQETARVTVQQIKKSHSGEDGIVDGYSLDDPEVLKMELQDSYNIMSVSRIKLLQYVTILRKYIPGNQIDELHQTLDGIEELCSLLKPKHQYLFNVDVAPVDPAFEADDDEAFEAIALSSKSFPISVRKTGNPSDGYEVPTNRVPRNVGKILQRNRKEVEMNVIRQSTIGYLDPSKYPQGDPVGERQSSE